ncbi:hypothetical protein C482_13950 [Natrialba chahannaoensis JCM 10990]|uniref:Uncharacterized protein n=1 Tax=Natrialba chahannaoensis JCM 10990 TaxID=1227492 RepID=M0AH54_9EURY|nr:hypothetical protein [Natrialba chahannaoensis]ELY97237.1 hypothetical protein C482_13950 [Natrialba chahannaoensis JCM 10990]
MTEATNTSREPGLQKTPFSIGSTVVAAICTLIGVLMIWTGYQAARAEEPAELAVVGTELNLVTGTAGGMFMLFVALVAFVAAFYMEPGFDQ